MDSTLPIWLFLFWTIGAPALWLHFDFQQLRRSSRNCIDRPMSRHTAW